MDILWETNPIAFQKLCLTNLNPVVISGLEANAGPCSEIVMSQRILPPHTPRPPVPNLPAVFNLDDPWIIPLLFLLVKSSLKSLKKPASQPSKVCCAMKLASERVLQLEAHGSLILCLGHKGRLPSFLQLALCWDGCWKVAHPVLHACK